MKKVAFFLLFSIISSLCFAQSTDDISDFIKTPGYDLLKAKAMIDKFQANPKNAGKADGWYFKARIYNDISKKDSLKSACSDCKMEAFEALKKYQEMDSKSVYLVLEQYGSFFDIYGNYFDMGAKAFNSLNYKEAFNDFKNAEIVEEYIRSKDIEASNGFKFPAMDTSLIQNTALAAKLAKDSADAAIYYKKLTDANLSDQQYLGAYEFLVQYYSNIKDDADYNAALEKGKKIYPKEDYWTAVELDQMEASGTKQEVFKKYDELLEKDSTNYTIAYNYAVELYNYIYANDDKTIKADNYREPLHQVLKKVIAIKPTGEANLLMARYLYNSSFDNSDSARKVKGPKPDDVKKKKALNDLAAAQLDECIPYAEAAESYYASMSTLKGPDKGNYRATISILRSVYEAKKNQPKADEYDKKMKALE
jgi:hypothetical protein